MKNPFMSMWLSEYNKMANAAKGQMMAEASRQQTAMMKEWSEQAIQMWMSMWFPWLDMGSKKKK